MSNFDFPIESFADSNTFILAAAENQTHLDLNGKPAPLKTTQSQGAPKKTMSIFSVSDAAMTSSILKPDDVIMDIHHRVGVETIARGIAENGGVQTVLGDFANVAPRDFIIKAQSLPVSIPNYSGGTGAVAPGTGGYDPGTGAGAATQEGTAAVETFLRRCLDQTGDLYVWGAGRTNADDPNSFDCSGLVYWACGQVGITGAPSTAYTQWKWASSISLEQGKATRGALLFTGDGTGTNRDAITHVGISLGDGNTIEARGKKWGVGSWEIGNRFQYAGLIPGMKYGTTGSTTPSTPTGGARNVH